MNDPNETDIYDDPQADTIIIYDGDEQIVIVRDE